MLQDPRSGAWMIFDYDSVRRALTDFAIPLPLMVIAEMIGIPPADCPRFRRWSDAILRLVEMVGGDDKAAALAEYRGAVHVHGPARLPIRFQC